MRFQIGQTVYEVDAVNKASLADLLNLKRKTGLGLADIQVGYERLKSYSNAAEALSDESALLTLGAVIWLVRWKAGERLEFEEACDFPLEELVMLPDPGDAAEDVEQLELEGAAGPSV